MGGHYPGFQREDEFRVLISDDAIFPNPKLKTHNSKLFMPSPVPRPPTIDPRLLRSSALAPSSFSPIAYCPLPIAFLPHAFFRTSATTLSILSPVKGLDKKASDRKSVV